jgi:hypothetical protein
MNSKATPMNSKATPSGCYCSKTQVSLLKIFLDSSGGARLYHLVRSQAFHPSGVFAETWFAEGWPADPRAEATLAALF